MRTSTALPIRFPGIGYANRAPVEPTQNTGTLARLRTQIPKSIGIIFKSHMTKYRKGCSNTELLSLKNQKKQELFASKQAYQKNNLETKQF